MTAEITIAIRWLELKGNVLLIKMEGSGAAAGRRGSTSIIYHDGAPPGIGMELLAVVGAAGNGMIIAGEKGFVLAGTMKSPVKPRYGRRRRNGHE